MKQFQRCRLTFSPTGVSLTFMKLRVRNYEYLGPMELTQYFIRYNTYDVKKDLVFRYLTSFHPPPPYQAIEICPAPHLNFTLELTPPNQGVSVRMRGVELVTLYSGISAVSFSQQSNDVASLV